MTTRPRLGKKKRGTDGEGSRSDRPRPVLVKFIRGSDKRRFISNRTLRTVLHKASVTMNDDLTVKQLWDYGRMVYHRGTRLFSTRRRYWDSERAVGQIDRFDDKDLMATTQT